MGTWGLGRAAQIQEMAYCLDSYPARITHLVYKANVGVQNSFKVLVHGLPERHMRCGAAACDGAKFIKSTGIAEGARENLKQPSP